jgi:hypothetical protein
VTRDGDYLWYYDQNRYYIGKTDSSGDSLFFTFEPNDHHMRGVTWDGSHLWAINTSGTIKRFDTRGALIDSVTGLLTGGWGLTFDGTFFWAASYETDKIYQLSLLDRESPTSPIITSPSHPLDTVWYSNPDPVFRWTPSTDSLGIAGYSYLLDHYQSSVPDSTIDGTDTTASYTSIADGVWYFHCRATDISGNWSEVDHLKLRIDTTPPSNGSILIAAGADTVNSLIVSLDGLNADDEHSGLGPGAAMRFSSDIVSWSEEEPFSISRTDWDLSTYGGNDLPGIKRVYASFKDAAGNWSVAFFDEIVYNTPLFIVTDSLTPGTMGFAYAGTLYASGGWPPYQWEMADGDLPPGLILGADGVLSGVPDSEGNFTFTVRVTDANAYTAIRDIRMAIHIEAVLGDVNGEGLVNVLDLITVVRYILGLEEFTPSQIWAADIQTDGQIDILDALGLANIILNEPMAKMAPSSSGAALWIEPKNRDRSYAIVLDSPVPVSGVQLSIKVPQGADVTSSPTSQHFTFSYNNENGILRALLYTLTNTAVFSDGPQTLLNLHFAEAAEHVRIESTLIADEQGRQIPAQIKNQTAITPTAWVLHQNSPNPFNPQTDIRYQIPQGKHAIHTTLKVYNLIGQEVKTLVDEYQDAGNYTITWDGRDSAGNPVPSGIYFCTMETGETSQAIKMILSK